jgi:RNA polymerase sigma-70 factor (ECF subfamily)
MGTDSEMGGMDDLSLIRRAQQGDSQSFSELLDLYYDTIHRFAWKWCGHAANADDIAQLACIKLANSLAQYRFQAAFTSWLYRLVISCAQDWQRSQQRHEHVDLPDDEPAEGGNAAEQSIYLLQLLAQLEKLGEGMKETALLVHGEGLSHAEAGAILGVTESTISWRVHTIRKHMNRNEVLPAKRGSGS